MEFSHLFLESSGEIEDILMSNKSELNLDSENDTERNNSKIIEKNDSFYFGF
ncbi:hypothetical protein NUSPORA_02193 [Nucleospora cyclopteri]